MPAIRIATSADVEHLAPRLREADVMELRAGSGASPREALMQGLKLSEPPLVGVNDQDEAVLMFGVATIEPGVGSVWMLSSDEIYQHMRVFLRESRKVLDTLNRKWPVLCNACDERNRAHIMWMKKLGYTFIARHERFGVEQRPFIEFVRVNFNV